MNIDPQQIRRREDLAKLPWFEKDGQGRLSLRQDAGLPPIIDVHSHLGWSYGCARPIDHTARPPLEYFYDYDFDQPILEDEVHPTKAEGAAITREAVWSLLARPRRNRSQTAANMADEVARFNYRAICILPIEPYLHSRAAREVLDASRMDERLVPFAAVHPWPWGPAKERRLEALVAEGAKGLKYHPEFQMMAPDHPHAMRLFEWCAAHDLPVLSHCGCTGAEPPWMSKKARPERFRPVLEGIPGLKLIVGHTGLRMHKETLAVVKDYEEQVWLDLTGLTAPQMRDVLNQCPPERIVYGSDWAFYPVAVSLARALAGTEGHDDLRPGIFHHNAAGLLGLAGKEP